MTDQEVLKTIQHYASEGKIVLSGVDCEVRDGKLWIVGVE